MVSMTHTMNLGRQKNKICQVVEASFLPKKTHLHFCYSDKTCRCCAQEK